MEVKILKEEGYVHAVFGVGLSFGADFDRACEVAKTLAPKDGGHNKFLESIFLWIAVRAPRYWWQEADTYRLSTKQSESTMHTIHNRDFHQGDFEDPIFPATLEHLNYLRRKYADSKDRYDLVALKNELPEGFIQERMWVMNYKTLRNIISQRQNHRLPQWQTFCNYMKQNVYHPEFLP